MNLTMALAWCLAAFTTVLAVNNSGVLASDVFSHPSLPTPADRTTGIPRYAQSTPSSRRPSSTSGITHMSRDREELTLFRDLFAGYDKRIRPSLNKENNVTVTLGISIHQLIDIDERNQMMRLSVWVRQKWNNPFLRWNESHYGGIKGINVDPSDVWKPDLVLYNNVDGSTDGSMYAFKSQIKVSSNGDNLWLSPAILLSSCKIWVKYFPFDEQHCTLKFGSWTYDGLQLDLVREAEVADIGMFVNNGEWDLVGVPCTRNVVKYVCCEEPYPDVTYEVQIRRRTLFFFFNMIIPCLVIVGLTILSFYLPPDSGERLSLVITNLLAMTVFMLLVAEIIPPTSDAVSVISTFYTCCIFEVGVALIGTCIVLKYHFSNPTIHKMPNWLRFVVLHCLGKVFQKKLQDDKSENPLETGIPFEKRKLRRAENGYIETFLPRNDMLNPKFNALERRFSGMARGRSGSLAEEREPKPPFSGNDGPVVCDDKSYLTKAITDKQAAIANSLEKLVEAQEAQDEEGKQRDEWMMAASILDNFFMWLFLFTLAASLVALFFQLPSYDK